MAEDTSLIEAKRNERSGIEFTNFKCETDMVNAALVRAAAALQAKLSDMVVRWKRSSVDNDVAYIKVYAMGDSEASTTAYEVGCEDPFEIRIIRTMKEETAMDAGLLPEEYEALVDAKPDVKEALTPHPRKEGGWWVDEETMELLRPIMEGENPQLVPGEGWVAVDPTSYEPIKESYIRETSDDEDEDPGSHYAHYVHRESVLPMLKRGLSRACALLNLEHKMTGCFNEISEENDLIKWLRFDDDRGLIRAVTSDLVTRMGYKSDNIDLYVVDFDPPLDPDISIAPTARASLMSDEYVHIERLLPAVIEAIQPRPTGTWWADEETFELIRPFYEGESSRLKPQSTWVAIDPHSYEPLKEARTKLPNQAQAVKSGLVVQSKRGVYLMTQEPEELTYQISTVGKAFNPFGPAVTTSDRTFKQRWMYCSDRRSLRFVTGKPVKAKGDPDDHVHEFKNEVYIYEVNISVLNAARTSHERFDDKVYYLDARDLSLLNLAPVARERTEVLPLVVGSRADGSLDYQDVECVVKDGIVTQTVDGEPVWRFDPDTLELVHQPSYFDVREKEFPCARLSDIEGGNV